jgi:hypothetical protein
MERTSRNIGTHHSSLKRQPSDRMKQREKNRYSQWSSNCLIKIKSGDGYPSEEQMQIYLNMFRSDHCAGRMQ